ncbi:MAG TPA: ABC transporter substrate binding protein [Candidatus Competibacter sp.]|nr:ABC transporter substrate binding protein [Candidatus Competibacter sp.]
MAAHYVDQKLPFVFSGVNKDPNIYRFVGSKNIAGVLEQEHFVESVNLLRQIVPGVKRIAAVFDGDAMWDPVIARMRERIAQVPEVEIVSWDRIQTFDEYQRKIAEYPNRADAIALIGIFNFKDAQGKNVPYQDVLRWTAENSSLPDFSFWIDRVHYGTLVAVTVSEIEQGLAAGRLARAILVEGKSPSSLPMQPTAKGHAVISLARANKLALKIKSGILLSAEVVEKFEWDK